MVFPSKMSTHVFPVVAGVADSILADVEDGDFAALSVYDKIDLFLGAAVDRLLAFLGANRALLGQVTDLISFGPSVYDDRRYHDTLRKAQYLGLTGVRTQTIDLGGASITAALQSSAALLQLNPEAVILIAGSEIPRAGFQSGEDYKRLNDGITHPDYETPYKPTLPSLYALLARRMMHDHDISEAMLENITRYFRKKVLEWPRAYNHKKPLKPRDFGRYIASPYGSSMAAVASDHGFATLVMGEKTLERLREQSALALPNNPVYVTGWGEANHCEYFVNKGELRSPSSLSGKRAMQTAGIAPEDLDYAWIYDCFTGMIPWQAANYFDITPNEAADTLASGELSLPTGNGSSKTIRVNLGGGILNYNAALAVSGATGLLDVLSQYGLAADPVPELLKRRPKHALLGGNGGLDSVNCVAILSADKPAAAPTSVVDGASLPLNNPQSRAGDKGTIYSSSTINFHPGFRKEVPFVVALVRLQNGHFAMANVFDKNGDKISDDKDMELDETKVVLRDFDGILQAVLDD